MGRIVTWLISALTIFIFDIDTSGSLMQLTAYSDGGKPPALARKITATKAEDELFWCQV